MRSAREGRGDAPGQRRDGPSEPVRESRGEQLLRSLVRLDDEHHARQFHDGALARELPPAPSRAARRQLGDRAAALRHALVQRAPAGGAGDGRARRPSPRRCPRRRRARQRAPRPRPRRRSPPRPSPRSPPARARGARAISHPVVARPAAAKRSRPPAPPSGAASLPGAAGDLEHVRRRRSVEGAWDSRGDGGRCDSTPVLAARPRRREKRAYSVRSSSCVGPRPPAAAPCPPSASSSIRRPRSRAKHSSGPLSVDSSQLRRRQRAQAPRARLACLHARRAHAARLPASAGSGRSASAAPTSRARTRSRSRRGPRSCARRAARDARRARSAALARTPRAASPAAASSSRTWRRSMRASMCALTDTPSDDEPRGLARAGAQRPARGPARELVSAGARRSSCGVALEVAQQVDAVEQRAAQASAVARQLRFAAVAAIAVARVAARARVGRREQHEAGGIGRPSGLPSRSPRAPPRAAGAAPRASRARTPRARQGTARRDAPARPRRPSRAARRRRDPRP